jgi:hypothetical protein
LSFDDDDDEEELLVERDDDDERVPELVSDLRKSDDVDARVSELAGAEGEVVSTANGSEGGAVGTGLAKSEATSGVPSN